ncbi:GerAB/ArcD/ProY family transporter [Brevibacillus brevis]|uniref:GerAB/ArcD/ProY family transporter n=1 Tax=Brevibacillus brevis TaxID=1393 RepID=UPI000D10A31F|nr:endospore germination permease [Brevibacillus brevis]PSJ68788.1 hypothetical protein C7J99_12420 [Brevibacillus brevis]RED29337.1 spore germination protein KB [Brevibacillus brevis]GEC91516.1 germination protein [Brevibacillus brevis]VEF87938.1 Spore germination protein YndE [Brevibacillus brevis]
MSTNRYAPKITSKQLMLLIVSSRVAVMTIFLPAIGTHSNAKDAWMSAILSGLIGLLLTWMVVSLARFHPNRTLVQLCISLLGKWLGSLLVVIFLWFFLHVTIITVRQFAEILNTALMPETPVSFFIVFVIVAVIFSVYRGLEAITRSNTITLPISLASILLILILVRKDIHTEAILPMLEDGWMPVIMGSVVPLAWHGEIILILMLYPYVSDKEHVLKSSLFAVLINTIVLLLISIAVIGVFGSDEALHLTLPFFSLVRMISVANFFERIEAMMVAVWISLLLTKMCIYLYAGVIGMGQWLHLRSYKFLIIPMSVLSLILSYVSFDSISDIKHFLSPTYWGVYALTISTILPMLLLIATIFLKRKRS